VRLPEYRPPRVAWRREIHRAVETKARTSGVSYESTDELEIEVRLYLPSPAARYHDVDNRLKDVMDALQGRAGGPKSEHPLRPIIPNDRQIRRVVIEKSVGPKQGRARGHLIVRAWRDRRKTG
jgi:Holliday junction resolvase RusA-like endonuclease